MYGYIYLTTNLTNNKKYIGQKKSNKFLHEKYLGSGKILKQAILKDGIENFKVDLLECCSSKEELNKKEIFWINYYNAVKSDEFYNIAKGGEAGSGGNRFQGHKHSEETKRKMSESRKGINNANYGNHWKQSDELKEIHRQAVLGDKNGMYGKTHTDSTKRLISNSAKNLRWVCNEKEILRIHTDELDYYLSIGYKRGRKF